MAATLEKYFVSPNAVHLTSVRLAKKVRDDGFKPDFLVALWRGGAPPGCIVQGVLAKFGAETDHIAIRTKSYDATGTQSARIEIYAIGHLTDQLRSHHRVLIVDDVFDRGRTIKAFLERMEKELAPKNNMPKDVRVAVLYYKGHVDAGTGQFTPVCQIPNLKPDYHVAKTARWLVFPHEFEDLTDEEIVRYMPEAAAVLGIGPSTTTMATEQDDIIL